MSTGLIVGYRGGPSIGPADLWRGWACSGYRFLRPRHQRCTCGCHALPRDANPPGPVTRDEL